jgi:hypothetical protein
MDAATPPTMGSWFAAGWTAFRRDPYPLMGGSVVLSAFFFGMTVVDIVTDPQTALTLTIMLFPVLQVGWAHLCLRQVRGEETWASEIFSAFRRFGAAWATVALYFLIVFAGFFLFIVPGIYLGCKFGLCFYPILERRASIAESIDISGRITQGHVGKIFGLYLLTGALSFLSHPFYKGLGLGSLASEFDGALVLIGAVPFLASLLVVTPWMHASLAAAYDSLTRANEGEI